MINPSFQLIPSAYKVSKLYAPIPNDGVGDMTFTRASTATRINEIGNIETVAINIPRIDYTNGCGELLLEPASTNLALRSEEIDAGTWIKQNATVTANKTISPDGTLNADLIEVTSATGGIYQNIAVTASTVYNYSFYVKIGTITDTSFAIFDTSNLAFIIENVSYTASVNQWTRIDATFTTPVGCTLIRIYGNRFSGGGIGTYYYTKAQLEPLSYATSYIPTTTGAVTRSAGICNNGGDASTFNGNEGVLYTEIAALHNDTINRIISISDGTANNRVVIYYNTISNLIASIVTVGGVEQVNINTPLLTDVTNFIKVALKWKLNDFALWVNGVEVATDLVGSVFLAGVLTEISFDNGAGTNDFYGRCKDLRVYKEALTDLELMQLTT
jgi:hypothetical protein